MHMLLRITAPDFCASAVFEWSDGAYRCVRAAPKIEALIGMDAEKAQRRCKAMGWDADLFTVYRGDSLSLPDPQEASATGESPRPPAIEPSRFARGPSR